MNVMNLEMIPRFWKNLFIVG